MVPNAQFVNVAVKEVFVATKTANPKISSPLKIVRRTVLAYFDAVAVKNAFFGLAVVGAAPVVPISICIRDTGIEVVTVKGKGKVIVAAKTNV